MDRVTLDTNALIDLEAATLGVGERREREDALLWLADAHRRKRILLLVPAISASERQQNGGDIANFADFLARVERAGIPDAEILRPLLRLGLGYWDWCVLTDEDGARLERQIHDVLFPPGDFEQADYLRARGLADDGQIDPDWRNRRCDVLALWSHIQYAGDLFVTSDTNFHRPGKREALLALGARAIMRPEAAIRAISA